MKGFKKLIAATLCVAVGVSSMFIPAGSVSAESSPTLAERNAELSREAAADGMVLLKNESESLPLKDGEKVALFGKGQIDLIKGGTGSGDVNVAYIRNLLQGMEIKQGEGKVQINETLAAKYRNNSSVTLINSDYTKAAAESNTAIVMITRNSGEGGDRSATEGDYYLNSSERSMLTKVCNAGFEDITVVLNIGGIMDTSWIADYPQIKSVLLAWQPGMEGGLAIADVLVGDVTPSGKLTDTFAKSYNDYSTSATFSEAPYYVKYTEDIYVGYRYFETFDPSYSKVNYEFGYGLSYTYFRTSGVTVKAEDDKIKVSAKVTNTGAYSGKEVVQAYFSAPQGVLGKPGKILGGFVKTGLLAPGESETVSIEFSINDMASYDDTGKIQKSAYLLEAGDYKIYLGNSVKNAGANGVRYTYNVPETKVTEQLSEKCTPNMLEKRLLADGTYETLETYETMDEIGQKISATGTNKIEAESFYYKHCHAEYNYSDDYTIGGVETYTSDTGLNRWMSYILDVEEAGNYALALGIGNPGSALTNSVKVYINDVAQTIVPLNFPATGGKWNIKEVGSTTVNLPKGKFVLKIECLNGDNFTGVIDYLKLTKGEGTIEDSTTTHNITSSGVNKIEGENYSAIASGLATETIAKGASAGGTCLCGFEHADIWSEYKLDVAAAGTYNLTFNASNGYGSDHNDGVVVSVNGTKQNGVVVNLPNTSVSDNQWHNFVDTNTVAITLPAGKVTLRFDYTSFGNLDYFMLEKSVAAVNIKAAAASVSSDTIMLKDVKDGNNTMAEFMAQLSNENLIYMVEGHGTSLPGGTGSIGGISEYGIPAVETSDGGTGIRLDKNCTAWPIATMLACTWDVELVEKVGQAIGDEAVDNDVDVWLAPGMNIHRNPLCGRNFEYYSEDPVVAGKIAAAMTKGVQSRNVSVEIKHFFANNRETNRGYSDSRMSERCMREVYLKGFEICVKDAQPHFIMSSYNHINGIQTAESRDLLTDILRGEWGYEGVVTTDWWNDSVSAFEIAAGNDVKMATGKPENIRGALANGTLQRKQLEVCVERILNFIMNSNAMDKAVMDPVYTTVSSSAATRIKATDYTWKYSEIGMEKCEDVDGGYNPTDTYGGRWLKYNIDVEDGGVYKVRSRVANQSASGEIQFSADGITLGSNVVTVNPGGWQSWITTSDVLIKLPAGKTTIQLSFLQGCNLNWFELEPVSTDQKVSITDPVTSVIRGTDAQFAATVENGRNVVNWSIRGNASASTSISADGKLTVSADETAESIIVYAAYQFDENAVDAVRVALTDKITTIKGDVDGDEKVTVSDVVALRRLIMSGAHTDEELAAGDFDTDKKLTVSDVVALRKYIMEGVKD